MRIPNLGGFVLRNFIVGAIGLIIIGLLVVSIIDKEPKVNDLVEINGSEKATNEYKQQSLYAEHLIDYSLQNEQLNITFNKGRSWRHVPIDIGKLFNGEYNGNRQQLIENSYLLTKDRASFLYSEYLNDFDHRFKVGVIYSLDEGKSWNDVVIHPSYSPLRFRKVDFLNEYFGYVIISGDRVVGQEMTNVFVTKNGGESWQEIFAEVTNLIYDGGFVDENTGFLSFGLVNPDKPQLFVIQDAGLTWAEATVHVPEKYKEVFLIAETPFKEEEHLAVLINQGPSGDYLGGKVKGKFISKDNGITWEFSSEENVNE